MNTDSPRRRRPKYHPHDELGPATLGVLASLKSLEMCLAEKSPKTSTLHRPAGPAEDNQRTAQSGAVQHSAGDPAAAADADAAQSHMPEQSAEGFFPEEAEDLAEDQTDDQADPSESNDLQHAESDFSDDDTGDSTECSTPQHEGDQAPNDAEETAADCNTLQHSANARVETEPNAAESNDMQHPESDFSDDDTGDSTECSTPQHEGDDPPNDAEDTATDCNTVQHSTVQHSPSAAGEDEPDAADSNALQHPQSASPGNLPAATESNTQQHAQSKLLSDPAIAAEFNNVQQMIEEFRSRIVKLHDSYRTPYAAPPVTPRQQTAIELLVAGATDTHAAQVIGVDRTTIWRWKKDPQFQAAFDLARELAFGETIDRLRALAPHAVECLEHHVRSGDQMAAVRLLRLIRVDHWGLGNAHRQLTDGCPLPRQEEV